MIKRAPIQVAEVFKRGNLLLNKRTRGLWVVDKVQRRWHEHGCDVKFKMEMDAICIQPGDNRIHCSGVLDTWYFEKEDGSDKSDLWEVVNEI